MIYKQILKVSKELLIDQREAGVKIIKGRVTKEKGKLLLKGMRGFLITIEFFLDGRDFMEDRRTVVITYQVYRVPRIIKNMLTKNMP